MPSWVDKRANSIGITNVGLAPQLRMTRTRTVSPHLVGSGGTDGSSSTSSWSGIKLGILGPSSIPGPFPTRVSLWQVSSRSWLSTMISRGTLSAVAATCGSSASGSTCSRAPGPKMTRAFRVASGSCTTLFATARSIAGMTRPTLGRRRRFPHRSTESHTKSHTNSHTKSHTKSQHSRESHPKCHTKRHTKATRRRSTAGRTTASAAVATTSKRITRKTATERTQM
mmetsp:Transcript_135951/g.378905  ORF Transcript_135951/g.378905 Transcript_135951/m.378905 type:complete len:226 (-) Transcript_135951:351-1028(-)